MNPSTEVLQRVDALAAKLGVTAQYIWSVLIRQAKVEAISDIVSGVLSAIFAFALWKLALWLWKIGNDDCWDNPIHIFGTALSVMGIVSFSAIAVCQFFNSITPIVNPEFWALQQVLNVLK